MRISLHASADDAKGPATMVFDIGGGSVGAAILIADRASIARVLFDTRITLTNEDRDENQLILGLAKALSEAGTAVLDRYTKSPFAKSHGPVKDVHAMIHAPWVRSLTRDSHITLTSPVRITREAIEKASKEAAKDTAGTPQGHIVFERTVVRVELNGYPTGLPVGKTASLIRVLALESSIATALQNPITSAITALLPGRTPLFHSAMYAYSTVVRELSMHASSFTFLDIESEASSCSAIMSGSITEQGSIPAGTRTLIRSATGTNGGSADSIYSMIRMIAEGTCSDSACDEAARVLEAVEPVFMRSFGEVFSTMITKSRLPNPLVISVHPTMAAWATAFFERLDFSQFTLTGKPFEVQVLTSRELTALAVFGPDATPDTGIAIIAALVHIRNA
jgi:hypothetical protein